MGASAVAFARCGVKLRDAISVEPRELVTPPRGTLAITGTAAPQQQLTTPVGIALGR